MNSERPFDMLNNSKGKEVVVELKNSKVFTGKLVAFDIHLNLSLTEAGERESKDSCDMIIRGDAIVSIKLR
jgi:small nuclear ribonucleoprotein